MPRPDRTIRHPGTSLYRTAFVTRTTHTLLENAYATSWGYVSEKRSMSAGKKSPLQAVCSAICSNRDRRRDRCGTGSMATSEGQTEESGAIAREDLLTWVDHWTELNQEVPSRGGFRTSWRPSRGRPATCHGSKPGSRDCKLRLDETLLLTWEFRTIQTITGTTKCVSEYTTGGSQWRTFQCSVKANSSMPGIVHDLGHDYIY
ncbi:hypothetical protein B0H21DRAFT_535862 [Amylocystis lapponica]|nr:hypothetical protein B0H21DRAFT_535862 [Amylocystis lapponica]